MNSQKFIHSLRATISVLRYTNQAKYVSKTFTTLFRCEQYSPIMPIIHPIYRNYAKNRDKIKSGSKRIEIREDIISEAINVEKYKAELQEVLDQLKEQYVKQLSLRSSTGVIETLPVEFEGDQYIIQDLAQINRKNPKLLALNFASFPQTIPTVLEVLNNSGMNLNPQQDGTSIFIPIPKVTREHRENLAKNAKTLFNKCKDNIRAVQNKYTGKLELKDLSGLSSDKILLIKEQLMAIANNYATMAEKIRNDKQKELLNEE